MSHVNLHLEEKRPKGIFNTYFLLRKWTKNIDEIVFFEFAYFLRTIFLGVSIAGFVFLHQLKLKT